MFDGTSNEVESFRKSMATTAISKAKVLEEAVDSPKASWPSRLKALEMMMKIGGILPQREKGKAAEGEAGPRRVSQENLDLFLKVLKQREEANGKEASEEGG